ncbi:acetyl-CoA carboxylase biotin carboxylase subunit [Sporosarcina sp. 179-K 3D1 HS]|uniref:acetyl-CoA carboxylase biotin carboxylase subunit n=1 Tax=Sporosarcina sp. 179-K 3D1 HS TaxID=3232169 RepID=UPI0039A191BF
MIKKVLIANRGEIVSRIIRTCNKLGIQSVAIYSEADEHAPYVKMADERYLIGPSRVNESYLNVNKILSIAKKANVDAIHPGYGFLSESDLFAKACEDAGFIFIGPSPSVIKQMGDKIAARKLMRKIGVPVIPGTEEPLSNVEDALEVAKTIGYPVMLKAASGGGGIGLQIANDEHELMEAFDSNSKRAEQFFGNGSMFIEKLLQNVRHIEIQILADHFGNVVHLFERECSIQRRNQKVVEEAPSSFVFETLRKEMGETSVKAAKSISYTNAGTIEYLVDEHGDFYFLEMNTRIQVEHPVTEEITGIDIVEQQISIAEGNELSVEQNSLNINGHSIEVRVYAEDPIRFLPSPGKITNYQAPIGSSIRIESTVVNGSVVSPFYDPMISKLIVNGKTREEAITRIKEALKEYRIEGIKTNIPLLQKVVKHEEFKTGNTTTDFINRNLTTVIK